MGKELIKPGTDNKPRGTYSEVGPRGGNVPNARVVHIDQGDRLPPTQKEGNRWVKKSGKWIYRNIFRRLKQ